VQDSNRVRLISQLSLLVCPQPPAARFHLVCPQSADSKEIRMIYHSSMTPKQTLVAIRDNIVTSDHPPEILRDAWQMMHAYWRWRNNGGNEPELTLTDDSGTTRTLAGDEFAFVLACNIGQTPAALPSIITQRVA
jgi:hypothetical protein